MKISKPMMIVALVSGSLLAWDLALRAGDTNNPPAKSFAGAPPTGAPPAGQRPPRGGGFDRILEQLDLTAEQKPKVQAILEEQRQKGREVRQDASLSLAEKQTKNKALSDNLEARMKALLTAEQYEKWQKIPHPGHGPRGMPQRLGQKPGDTNAPAAPPKQ